MMEFDELSLRGMAANIGAAMERALLAYHAGNVEHGQAWDLLAHEMAFTARTAARRGLSVDGKVDVANRLHDLREDWNRLAGDYPQAAQVKPEPIRKPPKPRARKNGPSYTPEREGKPSRCRGCGMPAGGGHYQGCFDRSVQMLALPAMKSVKPGTAAWMKTNAKLELAISESNDNLKHERKRRERAARVSVPV